MAIIICSSVMIKVKGCLRPILFQKIMVGFLIAIPFGTAIYLWIQTRNLHKRIKNLTLGDEDGNMFIGCESHKRKRGINEKESFEPSLSDEENVAYLETTLIDTKSRIEGLADTVRFLKKQIRTFHTDSNVICKILERLQACQKS